MRQQRLWDQAERAQQRREKSEPNGAGGRRKIAGPTDKELRMVWGALKSGKAAGVEDYYPREAYTQGAYGPRMPPECVNQTRS